MIAAYIVCATLGALVGYVVVLGSRLARTWHKRRSHNVVDRGR